MENNFKKLITDTFSSVFSQKGFSVVGIDIGSSFLKVVQLKKRKGKAILETYGELALGPYAGLSVGQATSLPPKEISEALLDLFKEANITSKESGMAIPLGSSLLSVLDMPSIDDKQLRKMIPIEARKYIPVPINEVTLDWWVIPNASKATQVEDTDDTVDATKKDDTPTIKRISVLVVAIHNEVINKYKTVINAAELQNNILELEIFSTIRSTFGNVPFPSMIFDMGAGTTKLAIVEQGIIRSQHIISTGSQNITTAISRSMGISIEKAEILKREIGLSGENENKKVSDSIELTLNHVFSEANRVLLNYQRKNNKNIRSVTLTGGGVLLRGLYEKAQNSFETDVVFADSFGKIETPAFLEPLLKDAGPEFAVAIGVALRKLQEIE